MPEKIYEQGQWSLDALIPEFTDEAVAAAIKEVEDAASAVEAFGNQAQHLKLGKGAAIPALCSFGPTTSEKMKNASIPVAVEAESPGLDGIVEALISYFSDKD